MARNVGGECGAPCSAAIWKQYGRKMRKNSMENIPTKTALVVGAGFAGGVVARELAEAGWKVTVIDKRDHIAGNAYDYVNEHGIRVHKYGPHLWHGNSDMAQEWASQFTQWVPYKHWVHAQLPSGEMVPLPINLATIETVFRDELHNLYGQVGPQDIAMFMDNQRIEFGDIKNSRQHVESSVGKRLCELFFAPYTKKMWDMDLADLPVSVAARIPTKQDYDPYYFPKDKYQCLPAEGYTAMFKKIFDHENIEVLLNISRDDFKRHFPQIYEDYVAIFTAEPIDTYYDCDLGELPWRSIKCHTYSVPLPKALSAPVVNFTHDGPHTRATEWKQLPNHGSNPYWTTLTVEEPCDYRDNDMERYYPVKTSHVIDPNRELYKQYRERAKKEGIHFIGRCGRYVYTDMQPCVNSTLTYVRNFLAGQKQEDEE